MIWQLDDLRLALRHCLRQRAFALVVVLTPALGLGANSAVFTLIDAVMLRSLPVERPGELYRLVTRLIVVCNDRLPTKVVAVFGQLVRTYQATSARILGTGGVSSGRPAGWNAHSRFVAFAVGASAILLLEIIFGCRECPVRGHSQFLPIALLQRVRVCDGSAIMSTWEFSSRLSCWGWSNRSRMSGAYRSRRRSD